MPQKSSCQTVWTTLWAQSFCSITSSSVQTESGKSRENVLHEKVLQQQATICCLLDTISNLKFNNGDDDGGPHPLMDEDFLLLAPPYTTTDALALLANPRLYANVDSVGHIGLDDAASINRGMHPRHVAVILNSLPPNKECTTFYIVTVGHCPGIYNSWYDAQQRLAFLFELMAAYRPLAEPLVIGVPAIYCIMKCKEIALCMYMNA
ncbi:hypothetical protein FISHEDRAFT_69168 [Fistulina hepatica ATCC 64428]|uniref:Ribonuclease H1 N-terminal domain-containing protein n=1 Tax=Fistulina hepatica ATCC 64428 TaxID=1128425 RepID=A0A0D7APT0_9AGAR|nr:hypothetical protein FISHEDRAFT_69168 [Fistulina hepatica ATCC 64428]